MSQVDEVRAAADIVRVVGDYVKLRKAGANFMGLCPFHQEKTPSFAVHPVKQIFHCFGCGAGGDVFKFVMLIESLTFPEALRRVAERAGVKLRESDLPEAMDAQARERAVLHKIHDAAARFYAEQISGTAEGRAARAYLADRGVSDEVVGRFRLGYASSEGRALWHHLSAAGFEAEVLGKSGLILCDAEGKRPFDRFRRRIMFPISNESGKVVAFGGRALGEDQPKYLNSPETPIYVKGRVLYHLDQAAGAIRKQDAVVLVEGYMDAIAVDSAGVPNVVASCGTSLTEAQVRLMGRYTRQAVVNFDPDSAGVAATERSLEMLLEAGFEVKVLALPAGKDPDSFVRQHGAKAYQAALGAAPNYLEYLTDRAIARHGLGTPQGKVAAANAVMPYLVKIPNPLMRQELASRLASRLNVDDRPLREQLKRAAAEGRREVSAPRKEGAGHLERKLLRAFLENPASLDRHLPELAAEEALEGLAAREVFLKIIEARQKKEEKVDVHRLRDMLSEDGQRQLDESLLAWGDSPSEEEVEGFFQALRRRQAERERIRLQAAIEQATRENDTNRVAELMKAKSLLMMIL
jgi:DNA primase